MVPRTALAAIPENVRCKKRARLMSSIVLGLPSIAERCTTCWGLIHLGVAPYVLRRVISLDRSYSRHDVWIRAIERCLRQMQKPDTLGFVVDEPGGVAGRLTLEDLLGAIVGEFQTNMMRSYEQITPVDDARSVWMLDGVATDRAEVLSRI